MRDALGLAYGLADWFLAQPAPIQAVLAVAALAAVYGLLVVGRLLAAALYGAFRGL